LGSVSFSNEDCFNGSGGAEKHLEVEIIFFCWAVYHACRVSRAGMKVALELWMASRMLLAREAAQNDCITIKDPGIMNNSGRRRKEGGTQPRTLAVNEGRNQKWSCDVYGSIGMSRSPFALPVVAVKNKCRIVHP
jgi:hypothetical protein